MAYVGLADSLNLQWIYGGKNPEDLLQHYPRNSPIGYNGGFWYVRLRVDF